MLLSPILADFSLGLITTQGVHLNNHLLIKKWSNKECITHINNALGAIGNSWAFSALEYWTRNPVMGYCSYASLIGPTLITVARSALDIWKFNPKGRFYTAVDFGFRHYDRFTQVVNLVACAAFLCLGAPLYGPAGVALGFQAVVIICELYMEAQRQRVLDRRAALLQGIELIREDLAQNDGIEVTT